MSEDVEQNHRTTDMSKPVDSQYDSATILHVSDLDYDSIDETQLNEVEYDAVVFTGDLGGGWPKETLESLNNLGDDETSVYMISGNYGSNREWDVHDWVEDSIDNDFEHLENAEYTIQDMEGYTVAIGGWFFGPQRTRNDASLIHSPEEELGETCEEYRCRSCDEEENWQKLLEENTKDIDAAFHHGVPYLGDTETDIDVLDSDKAPEVLTGKHNGSVAYRKFIETVEPAFGAGGHIHEGQGQTRQENTAFANGGPGRAGIITLTTIDNTTQVEAEYFSLEA